MKQSLIEYKINRRTGRALHAYKMIAKGDRVLVAVSGQDSLALLNILSERAKYSPIKYRLIAVHVNLGINKQNSRVIRDYLETKEIEYHIIKADLKQGRKNLNKTACFWCSWKRREAVFKLAGELNCAKVAFAHHLDDIIETYFLNIFFKGELSTMPPKLRMFNGALYLIRPFAYLEKKLILQYAREKGIPAMPFECPYGKTTNRVMVRKLIQTIHKKFPAVKENIYRSMSQIKQLYLPTEGI